MTVSDITVKTLHGRAAMYSILVKMPDEDGAADLAETLQTEVDPGGVRSELHVLRLDTEPTLIDAYTFDRVTAEMAHVFLLSRAA